MEHFNWTVCCVHTEANQRWFYVMFSVISKMADINRELEEKLREMCCIGDEKNARLLVERGVNLNAANAVNGWTPLHWAAKRGHRNIVKYLLQQCVDTKALTGKGETAGQVATDEEIRKMLGEEHNVKLNTEVETLPIVPNYLRNPEFFYARETSENFIDTGKMGFEKGGLMARNQDPSVTCSSMFNRHESNNAETYTGHVQSLEELVLKLRIANSEDEDFLEVDLDRSNLTFENLVSVCCDELCIETNNIKRIRKLPNTIVRNDKDVKRLLPLQELEVVLKRQTNE